MSCSAVQQNPGVDELSLPQYTIITCTLVSKAIRGIEGSVQTCQCTIGMNIQSQEPAQDQGAIRAFLFKQTRQTACIYNG